MSAIAKSQRKQAQRDLARDHKLAARARLKALKQNVRRARKELARRVREARVLCRAARKGARGRAAQIRAAHREAARAEIEAARNAARGVCDVTQLRGRERAAESLARAGRAFDAEGAYQAAVFRAVKAPRVTKQHVHAAALERSRESDDEVANNIPAELLPVWNARKSKTSPTLNASRTEVFLDWMHNHSADVARILANDIKAKVKDWEREERSMSKRGAAEPDTSFDPDVLEAMPVREASKGRKHKAPPKSEGYDWTHTIAMSIANRDSLRELPGWSAGDVYMTADGPAFMVELGTTLGGIQRRTFERGGSVRVDWIQPPRGKPQKPSANLPPLLDLLG